MNWCDDNTAMMQTRHEPRFSNSAVGDGSGFRLIRYSDNVNLLLYKKNRYVCLALTIDEAKEFNRRLTVLLGEAV